MSESSGESDSCRHCLSPSHVTDDGNHLLAELKMAIDRWGPVSGELLDTRGSGTETLGNLPRRAADATPFRVWRAKCPPCLPGQSHGGKGDTLPVTLMP